VIAESLEMEKKLAELCVEREQLCIALAAMTRERDDMMNVYRIEHEKHTAALQEVDRLRVDLKDANS